MPMVHSRTLQDDQALTIETVSAISRDITAKYDSRLRVMSVAPTDGEGGRAELLVTIRGCHHEPCVLMLNVTRLGQAAFERELREKLHDALVTHTSDR
jgi:hypothetical protein